MTEATEAEAESEENKNYFDPLDSDDSVELPTQLPIPLFDLHWIVTNQALPIPTPLSIPSLV